jgi:hypothetical protein
MEAKKLYQAFYLVERDLMMSKGEADSQEYAEDSTSGEAFDYSSDSEHEEDYTTDTPSDEVTAFDDDEPSPTVYVMKADQYKDLTGTVWIFLVFGILGLVIVLLNVIEVLHFLNGWIPNTVMAVLFLFFLYVAYSTNHKAKKVKTEIAKENELTIKINDWLKQNVTESFLASLQDASVSEEVNFIRTMDTIKELLIKEFGHQNLSYLDRLIEEFYNENF